MINKFAFGFRHYYPRLTAHYSVPRFRQISWRPKLAGVVMFVIGFSYHRAEITMMECRVRQARRIDEEKKASRLAAREAAATSNP